MTRSTFDGPILSGDRKDTALRDVGYTVLRQACLMDVTVTTPGTAGYGGGSGVFVTPAANSIGPNVIAQLYTPSTTAFPPVLTTPTADSATQVLRGAVFYLPVGSSIANIFVDVQNVLTSNGTTPAYAAYVSNNFATTTGTYATLALTNTAGARTTATFSAAQLPNAYSTPIDIPQSNAPAVSQLVVTLAFTAASGITTLSAGRVVIAVEYTQVDPQVGNSTTYPYMNLV